MAKKSEPVHQADASSEDWDEKVLRQWASFVQSLAPGPCPDLIGWRQPEEIAAVLERLGRELKDMHYTFLPAGGGLELTGACKARELGCIQLEILDGELQYVCRPASLMCMIFPRSLEWSYFDLKLRRLKRSTKAIDPDDPNEDAYGRVITRRRAKDGRTVESACERSTQYQRLLWGRIVIFAKTCLYNHKTRTSTDDRHNKMSRQQFRQYIQTAINYAPFGAEAFLAQEFRPGLV